VGVVAAAVAVTLLPASPSAAEPPTTAEQAQNIVDGLYDQAEVASEDYNEARLEVADAQRRLNAVKSRIAREERALSAIRDDISVFAAASYRNGGIDTGIELLLSDDPAAFLERSASLDQVSRGQGAALRRAAVSQQRLAQDRAALAGEVAALKAIETKAADAKARIDAKVAEAKAVVDRLEAAERARYEAQQAARAAAAARASREAIRRVAQAAADESSSRSRSSDSSSEAVPSAGSGRASIAVAAARSKVGSRYVWGGSGPNVFDCSGLTSWAWSRAGVSLPHQSRAQYSATSRVSKSQLRPGDLVFFYSPISHVGIYVGGGLMVHASNPRTGVRVDSISSGYWAGAYVGGGRV
jgi:cell wall-associated NlpC family hydrolase